MQCSAVCVGINNLALFTFLRVIRWQVFGVRVAVICRVVGFLEDGLETIPLGRCKADKLVEPVLARCRLAIFGENREDVVEARGSVGQVEKGKVGRAGDSFWWVTSQDVAIEAQSAVVVVGKESSRCVPYDQVAFHGKGGA